MNSLSCVGTGLIYRNPKPHVANIHAYFPSVVALDNGEMLASFTLGEAFESANLHTCTAHSTDGGETWSDNAHLLAPDPNLHYSNASRITALPGAEAIAFVVRHDRSGHPGEGLANEENLGFVPTELLLMRSHDGGRSWENPQTIEPPLVGPGFELCCPIVPLRDGRWLLPTSTWRGWDGDCPNGMRMVAFVSHDNGATWPEYLDVMNDIPHDIIFWESKIVELADGALLAVAWVYDEANGKDLCNHYTISRDSGATWLPPRSTNLHGQTMSTIQLPDGRLFSVYRRTDEPGLWANIAHLDGDNWITEENIPLWGTKDAGLAQPGDNNKVHEFNELKFGAPCIVPLPDGTIYVAFWCYEKMVSNIRWFKLALQ